MEALPKIEDGITQDLLTLFDEGEEGNFELLENDLLNAALFNRSQLLPVGSDTAAVSMSMDGTSTDSAAPKSLARDAPSSSRPGGEAGRKRSAPAKRESRQRVRDNDKLREMEALAAAKLEQYLALTQRNVDLKLRNAVLSEALVIRDAQLSTSTGKPWAVPPLPAELAAATSLAAAARLPGSMKLVCTPAVEGPNLEAVRAMGRQQLLDQHQVFLAELSVPLLALEDNPADEAAAATIHGVLTRLSALYRTASVVSPDTVAVMLQTHLETRELSSAPPGHWAAVLQKLELTPQQVAEFTAVYGVFRGVMDKLLVERRAINARLTQGLAAQEQKEAQRAAAAASACAAVAAAAAVSPGSGPGPGPQTDGGLPMFKRQSSSASGGPGVSGGGSGSGGAGHHQHHQLEVPPEAEVLPALSRNLRKESAAHLLLRGFMFGRTLSLLQMARVMVHSYPWFPNATALTATAAGVPDFS